MKHRKQTASASLILGSALLAACQSEARTPDADPGATSAADREAPAPQAAAKPAEAPRVPADARGAVELRLGVAVDVRWSERPLLAYVWKAQDGTRIDLAIRVEPTGDTARLESTVNGKSTTVVRFAYDEANGESGMILEAIGGDQLCFVTTHAAGRRSHWSTTAVLAMYARDSQNLAVYETWSGSIRDDLPAWAQISRDTESQAAAGNL